MFSLLLSKIFFTFESNAISDWLNHKGQPVRRNVSLLFEEYSEI